MEIREALTFDDVLLEPGRSSVLRPGRYPHAPDPRHRTRHPAPLVRHGCGDRGRVAITMAQNGGIKVVHKH